MEMKFDVPINCPPDMQSTVHSVFHGEYDIPLVFAREITVLDLGANCGSFALWATHRFPGCRIKSYEPHPETFRLLDENTKRYSNIQIHNFGVGDPGLRALNLGPNNSGESSFHAPESGTGESIECEVKSPDVLPDCDLMKLDIEGCELEVLRPYLASGKRPQVILLEWHNHTIREELDRLLSPDYFLIGGFVNNIAGLGVSKWLRKDLV
jgi:FkbM family methyltransferase